MLYKRKVKWERHGKIQFPVRECVYVDGRADVLTSGDRVKYRFNVHSV